MPPTTRTAPALPLVDDFAVQVRPMSVRCEYQLGTRGHRFVGVLRNKEVIDTGWLPTAEQAATAYGTALAPLAVANAARYLS